MKGLLLTCCISILGITATCQLIDCYPELHGNLQTGEEVWRIFLETADSDDRVTAVFAAGGNTLVIGSSGGAGIINNQFGSVTGEQLFTNYV